MFSRLFCRHYWKVLSDVILESAFEQIARTTESFEMERAPRDLYIKTHVVILTCRKCGRIRKKETMG